jgi:hypothetical protein
MISDRIQPVLATTLLCLAVVSTSRAATVTYIDEGDYLAALATIGLDAVGEGFEDNTDWGAVRTTISGANTAPSITSQGVTWESNNSVSNVTTSSGAAVTGNWGFYSLPHGDFSGPDHSDDVPDGFGGSSTATLFGVGGWFGTNTPSADISLFLDSALVDFGDDSTVLGTTSLFFGAIDTEGFNAFLWQETEGTYNDQKYIFADDFTLALNPVPIPAAAWLFGSALLGLGVVKRKKA